MFEGFEDQAWDNDSKLSILHQFLTDEANRDASIWSRLEAHLQSQADDENGEEEEMADPIQYTYTDINGIPIRECPMCDCCWVGAPGLKLNCILGDDKIAVDTVLDDDGVIEDVNNMIASGFHSHTECGGCGEMLINMDGVIEVG